MKCDILEKIAILYDFPRLFKSLVICEKENNNNVTTGLARPNNCWWVWCLFDIVRKKQETKANGVCIYMYTF